MRKKIRNIFLVSAALCLASSGMLMAQSEDAPDEVVLDSMVYLYEAVSFDHAAHVDMVDGDCSRCHHHTATGETSNSMCLPCHAKSGPSDEVACRDCHAANRYSAEVVHRIAGNGERYHIDQPGLKGAYHRLCRGCHADEGGPTGCTDCHARTDEGNRVFRTGSYAPAEPQQDHKGH